MPILGWQMYTYQLSGLNTSNICRRTAKICDNLDAASRHFWWKPKKQNGKYLAWKAWDKLCLPKGKGGLGFKKAKDTNRTLLAKLAWMVASKRDNLCMAILRAKYKVRQDWLCKDLSKFASPIWKAIDSVKDIIVKGACYLIGDRASINVWQDPWIPWIQGFFPKPKSKVVSHTPLMVSQLLCFFWRIVSQLVD